MYASKQKQQLQKLSGLTGFAKENEATNGIGIIENKVQFRRKCREANSVNCN
jgi:hypothetical protein